MEKNSSTPLFAVGQEIANFLISCGILSKACEESDLARASESFSVTEHEGVAYVTFPSFHKIEGFIVAEGENGLGNIQTNSQIFSEGLKGNDDQPALVHQGALNLFLHIMEKTDFQAKLQIYTDFKQRDLKPIIFVGHCLGGAIATLATLWVLQRRLRQCSPFCITFGCPLVGDERLVEAVGRQKWEGNFLHVISQHDIVPRMLLAPLKSIAQPLTAILPYWRGRITYSFIQDACRTLLNNVLQDTSTVENSGVDSFGRSDGVIKGNPYKPFGTYMFCSSNGAACIDNSETVLNMLNLTMRSLENLSENNAVLCISEHIDYGSVLKHVIENSISGRAIDNSNSESSYEMGITLQLDALDVRGQRDHKWIFLPITGDMENHLEKNVARLAIELSIKKAAMAELEWYKEFCEKNDAIGYYDTFKNGDAKDIRADGCRVKLAGFWDEVIEMWESNELPSDFQSRNKWINAGTTYRRLLEPLDISYYYRCNRNGNYLSDGRYNRHIVLQKWFEEREKTRSSRVQERRTKPASLTQDSCFWAHVEEALKDLESLKQGQHQRLQRLQEFEEYVTKMVKDLSISSDVFLEGSSFMEWLEEWKEYNTALSPEWSSPLYKRMQSRSPVKFERIDRGVFFISKLMKWWKEWKEYYTARLPEWSSALYKIMQSGSPFKFERIDSLTVAREKISSTGEVKESIPPNKESDLAQLSSKEIELIPQQGRMFELEWYKMISHEKGDGYYDWFKNQNDKDNGVINLLRVTLNEFWDGIIGVCNSPSLPSDFKSRNKWINAGTAYRKLVEPLDIAHHYSTPKDSGSYLDRRPARYKVLEQWLNHRKENRSSSSRDQKADRRKLPFLTRDSCFWARVEEALKDLKEGADQKKGSLENFEKYVTEMINDCKISSDVFLEGSSFMKWWRDYKEHQTSEWKLESPLFKRMESEFWKP